MRLGRNAHKPNCEIGADKAPFDRGRRAVEDLPAGNAVTAQVEVFQGGLARDLGADAALLEPELLRIAELGEVREMKTLMKSMADRLSELIRGVTDPERLTEVGDWIIDCGTEAEFLARAER